ncbi:MAG: protein translocase subunit SecD [Candidatus Riflebacteria bacterium]|nr:protein translocase subunit SecD [Candidatus Riflebacteria bacterium]
MYRVEWGKLAIVAALFLFALIVCAPTLHISRAFSMLPLGPDYASKKLGLGLDLQGGVDLTYQVSRPKHLVSSKEISIFDMAITAKEVLTDRIDMFGVSNATIQIQGDKHDQIRIQVPTQDDRKQREIKDVLRITHLLQFNEVLQEADSEMDLDTSSPDTMVLPLVDQKDPKTGKVLPTKKVFLLKQTPEITGDYLHEADVVADQFGKPKIHFEWNAEGAIKSGEITGRLIGKQLAIVLGGKVYMAPVVRDRITNRGQITGNFDLEEARRVVRILRAGALPADLKPLAENTVGPSLGADSIRQGIRASQVGSVLVVVFMLFLYKLSGVFSILSLLLNLLLQLCCLLFLEATLTLPGIAGFALTVGMAVDSNILIFERTKEELRAGKTVRAAIDAGYAKAFVTIIDSHITTILTALVLYYFGTGPIRGFSVTLIVGLLVNLFTAVWVSRVMQDSWYSSKSATTMSI